MFITGAGSIVWWPLGHFDLASVSFITAWRLAQSCSSLFVARSALLVLRGAEKLDWGLHFIVHNMWICEVYVDKEKTSETVLVGHFQHSSAQVQLTIRFPYLIDYSHSAILAVCIQTPSNTKCWPQQSVTQISILKKNPAGLVSKVLFWAHWSVMLTEIQNILRP